MDGMALILRDRKNQARDEQLLCVVLKEEAARNRRNGAPDRIRIRCKAAEARPLRHLGFQFRSVHARARKGSRQTHAGIEQKIVVAEVSLVAKEGAGVNSQMIKKEPGDAEFAEITARERNRELPGLASQTQHRG